MRFADSETQRLLRDTARSYLAGKFPWERLLDLESSGAGLTESELVGFAERGWFGLVVPESAGGGGLSLLEAAVVVEEFGYAAVPSPTTTTVVACYLLARAGDQDDALAALASGDRLYTIGEGTRRRSNGSAPVTIAAGRIDGVVRQAPFASIGHAVLAPAAVDGEPAFVALPFAGARLEPVELLDRGGYANLHYEDMPAEGYTVLATGVRSEALHEQCDALSTALTLVGQAGTMQRILEMTTEYISQRVQFGQPVGKFQAARHRAAEIFMFADTTRWAAYHALDRFQADPADTSEIWLAKHWATRAVERVFVDTHMLHGGVGANMEYPLHLLTQSLTADAVRGGTMDELVARTIESLELAQGR
jgi:alkylation response protein AidB-like acyl-CoA dehydrogenase